jgi:hypothetical protein
MDDIYTQPKPQATWKELRCFGQRTVHIQAVDSGVRWAYGALSHTQKRSCWAPGRRARCEDRTIEQREEKRDEAIKLERHAKKKLAQSEQEAFELLQAYTALDSEATNTSKRLSDPSAEYKDFNLAMLTRSEKQAWVEKIANANKRAEQAMLDTDAAQTAHNQQVAHSEWDC